MQFSSCPCALQFVDVCCTDWLMAGWRWMARTTNLINASQGGKLGRVGNVLFSSCTFTERSVQSGVLMVGGCARIELCNYLTWWVLKTHQKSLLQGGFFAAGAGRNYSTWLENSGSVSLQGCSFCDLSFEWGQYGRESFCSGKTSGIS